MSQSHNMEGAPAAEHPATRRDQEVWAAVAAQVGGAVLVPLPTGETRLTDYYQPYNVPPGQRFDRLTTPEGRIVWGLARAVGHAALQETQFQAHEERCLSEVDHLLLHRQPDGTYPQDVLDATHVNNLPRVKEPTMPFAVSTTFQEYVDGEFWWRRQSGLQVGASGYRYHEHEAALQRTDVEVVEAIFVDERLEPGQTIVLFTARMSRTDASAEIAQHENLADDDSIRIQWIAYNPDGSIRGKYVQSILIKSDLRKAWVAMLADPNNIFDKAIIVEDPDSALSLMKAFPQMQLDSSKLPEGVVTLLEATLPYIADPEQRKEVLAMLPEYRNNPQRMQQVAEDIATRWDAFDIELANSLATNKATPAIIRFIGDVGQRWNDNDLALFARHQIAPGEFKMSRELAVRLERAQESLLCAEAGVLVKNTRVLQQVSEVAAARIAREAEWLHYLVRSGASSEQIAQQQRLLTQLTAAEDIEAEGGCLGKVKGNFRKDDDDDGAGEKDSDNTDRHGSKKFTCPTCKRENERRHEVLRNFCQHCNAVIPRCDPAKTGKGEEVAAPSVAESLVGMVVEIKRSKLTLAA